MRAMAAKGTLERTRDALRSPDFRRLFVVRLASQFADGLFQVVADRVGRLLAGQAEHDGRAVQGDALVIALPYSVIGPFTGVFIDRWSRRRILVVAPLAAGRRSSGWSCSIPSRAPVPFFAGALLVISVNRFFLATAQAVVPRLVPDRGPADGELPGDRRRHGRAARRRLRRRSDRPTRSGTSPPCIGAGALWLVGSLVGLADPERPGAAHAARGPRAAPSRAAPGRRRVRRRDRAALVRTPRAIGPITSISLDQMGQGLVLTLVAGGVPRTLRRGRRLVLEPDRRRRRRRARWASLTVGALGGPVLEGADRGRRVPRRRRSCCWPSRSSITGTTVLARELRGRA